MSWNYRVMKHVEPHPLAGKGSFPPNATQTYFSIHEVFYDKDGKPESWTMGVGEIHADSAEELKITLAWMREALDKPVLDYGQKG